MITATDLQLLSKEMSLCLLSEEASLLSCYREVSPNFSLSCEVVLADFEDDTS